MPGPSSTRQRSFRLAAATLEALGARAHERGESANSLASRLITEGLRTERHPLIWFREGAAGRRPALLGTRLDVADVVSYLEANGADAAEVATLLDIPEHWVRAAGAYHREFSEEIEGWLARDADHARRMDPGARQSPGTDW